MFSPEVLKRPMQTSVTVDNLDFEKFEVEEQLHIGIMLKDFKSIATHAESLKTNITAQYSVPTRPMQFAYTESGMQCEFTLMTIGEYRGSSLTPAPAGSRQTSTVPLQERQQRPSSRQRNVIPNVEASKTIMAPPPPPANRRLNKEATGSSTQRPSPPPPKPSLDLDSLFLPQYDDEDRQWGETMYDDHEDTVGWSATALNVGRLEARPVKVSLTLIKTRNPRNATQHIQAPSRLEPYRSLPTDVRDVLPATQRVSQVPSYTPLVDSSENSHIIG